MGFGEKRGFLPIFALTIVWRCGGYGPFLWDLEKKGVFLPIFALTNGPKN